MAKLQLTNYKRKGIYAYLVPLSVVDGKVQRGQFMNGSPVADEEERFYAGKSATVEIALDGLTGFYEYKEAVGHRTHFGYLKLENGEIIEEYDSLDEVVELLSPLPDLPELEGSDKQVAWAETIRATAIRGGFDIQKALDITSAKAWIDNRSKLSRYGVQ